MLELHEDYCMREGSIVSFIDTLPWDTTLARRTQQYGFRYDFKRKTCTPTTPIPPALQLTLDGVVFTQLIVNEYVGNQSIASHTDAPCFGSTIAIISLGDPCYMHFTRGKDKRGVLLSHNSLLVMSGSERYDWKHAIGGQNFRRRISLTYRTMA
jgi:alkylated DNA repair dioxygenase AlkB